MKIRPFLALHATRDSAPAVACQPYDTIETAEAAALAAGNPQSYLRVVRPEINLPGADPTSEAAYASGADALRKLEARGTLVREPAPALYVYRQEAAGRAQHGVAACCSLDEYEAGAIRKHEKTRRDKELDRARHIRAVAAHNEPVFLAYRDSARIDAVVRAIEATAPFVDFTSPDGVRQTLWRAPRNEPLVEAFAEVPAAYVADGHHRIQAAATVRAELKAANPGRHNEEWNWVLAVVFPASQLRILPYNRCVRDLAGASPRDFLDAAGRALHCAPGAGPTPPGAGHVSMYAGGKWYDLSWPEPRDADPVARLDVSVLQDRLLAPVLGIQDPRTDTRIFFVGGIKGPEELARRVDSGEAAVAFSMHPVSVDQVMAVSDAGRIMPPKSTWFEPKLKSGLFLHTF